MSADGPAGSRDDDDDSRRGKPLRQGASTSRRESEQPLDALASLLPWSAGTEDIPRSIDHHPPSSTSSTPTLRADSLLTLPSGSPHSQPAVGPPSHPAVVLPERVDTVSSHLPATTNSSALSESRGESAEVVITAAGSSFSEYEDGAGAVRALTVEHATHHFDLGEASHRTLILPDPDSSSNPSTVTTTPSAPADGWDRWTVDCRAHLRRGVFQPFTSRLDTGSDHNVISARVPIRMGITDRVEACSDPPITVINHEVPITGVLPLTFDIPGRVKGPVRVRFKVVPEDDNFDSLLCANFVDTHIYPVLARLDQEPASR